MGKSRSQPRKLPAVFEVPFDEYIYMYCNEKSVLTPSEKQATLKDLAWWPRTQPVSCRQTRVGVSDFTP